MIRTSPTGNFRIPGMPPGDYFLVAVDAETSVELRDAQLLNTLVPLGAAHHACRRREEDAIAVRYADSVTAMAAFSRSLLALALTVGPVARVSAQNPPPPPPRPAPPTARDSTQVAPTGTGVIGGTILTDEQAPRPVSRVLVSVFNSERRGQYYAISDPQGRFQVRDLPAGRYTLYANRPGYLPSYYGATKPWRGPSVPISLADGQQVTDLTLRMIWGAAVTGTIRDASGQPMSGIRVQIMEPRTINGERVLSSVPSSSSLRTTAASTASMGCRRGRMSSAPPRR